jgi:hypothetical protein
MLTDILSRSLKLLGNEKNCGIMLDLGGDVALAIECIYQDS